MSAWSPLRYRVYRALWIALLVSNIGTWMQAVGAAWLMVQLDASPAVVALVQTATYLPVVVLGVLAGAAADLFERRRLLLVTQTVMLAAAGALAVLSALDLVTPWWLLALTFALGVGATFNAPAWQAIQPEIVPPEELKQAVTLGGANINLGRAIGPALGGVLIVAAGPWLVFALNAASFAFVLYVLWRWKRPAGGGGGTAGALRRGGPRRRPLRGVLAHPLRRAGALVRVRRGQLRPHVADAGVRQPGPRLGLGRPRHPVRRHRARRGGDGRGGAAACASA